MLDNNNDIWEDFYTVFMVYISLHATDFIFIVVSILKILNHFSSMLPFGSLKIFTNLQIGGYCSNGESPPQKSATTSCFIASCNKSFIIIIQPCILNKVKTLNAKKLVPI